MRVFDGFTADYDVSPDWLVNPETRRRLKLDVLYPEIGVAVRFHGLLGRERRQRPSLEEEHQQKARDVARADLCKAHSISLVTIDVMGGEPRAILRELSMALSDTSRRLAKGDHLSTEKGMLIEQISQARHRLNDVGRRLRRSEDLTLYADLWQDRQYLETLQSEPPSTNDGSRAYTPGMAVRHTVFGNGVVQAIQSDGEDSLITVHFADGTQRIFAASLVTDKLIPH
jgi:hypothetical protein